MCIKNIANNKSIHKNIMIVINKNCIVTIYKIDVTVNIIYNSYIYGAISIISLQSNIFIFIIYIFHHRTYYVV